MTDKIIYDDKSICPLCGGENQIKPVDYINYDICECKTLCKKCDIEQYWAYGFYQL
jgi:hypothetical protein